MFLDEIGDMPLLLDAKLLRAVQEQEIERVGGNRTIHVDIRIIAAINQNLKAMVIENRFRADLYYPLAVFPLKVPPLRQRREDIPLLICYFVQKHAARMNRNIETIGTHDLEALTNYDWPGNVSRTSEHYQAVGLMSNGRELDVALPELDDRAAPVALALHDRRSNVSQANERTRILDALREAGGQVGGKDGAAARLALKRTTLR